MKDPQASDLREGGGELILLSWNTSVSLSRIQYCDGNHLILLNLSSTILQVDTQL